MVSSCREQSNSDPHKLKVKYSSQPAYNTFYTDSSRIDNLFSAVSYAVGKFRVVYSAIEMKQIETLLPQGRIKRVNSDESREKYCRLIQNSLGV